MWSWRKSSDRIDAQQAAVGVAQNQKLPQRHPHLGLLQNAHDLFHGKTLIFTENLPFLAGKILPEVTHQSGTSVGGDAEGWASPKFLASRAIRRGRTSTARLHCLSAVSYILIWRLLECGSGVILKRVGKRMLGEPGVEDCQLIVGRIAERDAHAHSFVGVNDVSFGCEGPLIAGDDHVEVGAYGKWVESVHVASLATDFVDSSHHAGLRGGLDDFCHGDEGIAGYRALRAVC